MKLSNDLGKDPIKILVLKLAIPSMLAQLVTVLYSIIDRMFIGHIPYIGNLALAGVGVCGPITTFITSFGTLIGLGGSILMAMRMGAGRKKQAEELLANSFLLLVIFSSALTFIFLLIKDKLLIWFGASGATFPYADTYMTIYTIGCFFAIMAVGLNYFITCQGFAASGMFTVVLGAAANIVLDAVFIFVFDWQVSGAAWATVISQMLSFIFALCFLLGKKIPISITFKGYSLKICKRILAMGFSPFFILTTDSIIIIVMNSLLQKYGGESQGDLLISAMTIMQSGLFLITGPLIGLTGGTQSIISYNYGARSYDRIKHAERCIIASAIMLTSFMFVTANIFAEDFVRFFTDSSDLISLSTWGIKTFILFIIPLGVEYSMVDGLTALGQVKHSLFISMFRKSSYIVSAIIIPMFLDARYIFFAEPVADILGTSMAAIVFFRFYDYKLNLNKKAVLKGRL